jgi:hypothetical protein
MAIGCALIAVLPGMARHWRLLDRAERLVDEGLDGDVGMPIAPAPVGAASDDPLRFGARPTIRTEHNGGNGAPLTPDEVRLAEEAARQRAASWR